VESWLLCVAQTPSAKVAAGLNHKEHSMKKIGLALAAAIVGGAFLSVPGFAQPRHRAMQAENGKGAPVYGPSSGSSIDTIYEGPFARN
jgi:hypothetical protein